ncbi:MAG: SAM-dependent methyltransferase, partial [Polyangiaceae bacterium]
MKEDRPSITAQWVAFTRGLGACLPRSLHLVDDPYGLRFAGGLHALSRVPGLAPAARRTARIWLRGPLQMFTVYMQLRTRAIDDDVAAFTRGGGRQIVLLGAGFDCRAWRIAALAGTTVFEVDHPATQAKKRFVMGTEGPRGHVIFVPWDFEHEVLADLPARLERDGFDPRAPTMTIIEGVLMYLTTQAIDATFACIASYSAPGSPVAMT